MKMAQGKFRISQLGLTLVELMVSIAISMTVLSGVVQVLVVSKSNFITERELATLQENARYAVKFLADEIRMAGYTGCSSKPLYYANSVRNTSSKWYLDNTGIQGFEYDAGVNTFPVEFRSDVAANTDSVVIRRGETTGLSLSGNHNPSSAVFDTNKNHTLQKGQILMLATPNCTQVGIFQYTGNSTNKINHNQGNANPSPGNCYKDLGGNYDCSNTSGRSSFSYVQGSRVMIMHSDAYYIGVSESDSSVRALFRERLELSGTTIGTTSDELVQGVENLQILYGLDNAFSDGVADVYVKANSGSMNWDNVVTVRLTLRMRSILPVYNENVTYPVFEGVTGTGGSDRYMRQTVSTTIQIRNS